MDDGDLRVGLIGFGLAGSVFHAPLISTTAGLSLSAVVTSDAARQAQVAKEYPDAAVFSDADALLSRAGDLDAVVVATTNRTHAPLATAALEAGLAVVVDKPLAPTSEAGQKLVELAAQKQKLLTVFQNRRWDADFLTLRKLLQTEALGTVHRFESRFERWRPVAKGGWREQGGPDDAPGLLYDLGAHVVDQALQLFGPVTTVYAEADVRRDGVTGDDDSFIALTHTNGVRSHLWVSAVAADLGPRFRVLGSEAAFVVHGLDTQEDTLRDGSRPAPGRPWGRMHADHWPTVGTPERVHAVAGADGAYPVFYRRFADALRTGGPAPVDPADAVAGLRIIEAAHVSAREGGTVRL